MPFILKIIVPENVVFEGNVDSVILPTELGEVEILENHMPIIGILDAGSISYKKDKASTSMAIDYGFFKFIDNKLILLTEAVVDVKSLDDSVIDNAINRAQEAINKAKAKDNLDVDELDHLDKVLRFSIAQKLTKQNKHLS